MCSIYIFEYACGCKYQEEGVVPCVKQGTPECKGVKEQPRARAGFRCPRHGTRLLGGSRPSIAMFYDPRVIGIPALSVSASR
ncbi:hypothetical protein N7530_009643 [Penicillium desertorum]|uniref:Uncharacterized protein n=1 Tax=Penicillium desertorum TaxID=1303715 RepID=A0A9W9WJ03_9EURO|nr:hypothetical protein N7530_009643 [Penicillium desertorum]